MKIDNILLHIWWLNCLHWKTDHLRESMKCIVLVLKDAMLSFFFKVFLVAVSVWGIYKRKTDLDGSKKEEEEELAERAYHKTGWFKGLQFKPFWVYSVSTPPFTELGGG